jgi:hypothetical protein
VTVTSRYAQNDTEGGAEGETGAEGGAYRERAAQRVARREGVALMEGAARSVARRERPARRAVRRRYWRGGWSVPGEGGAQGGAEGDAYRERAEGGSGAEGETGAEEEIPARRAERTGRERCGGRRIPGESGAEGGVYRERAEGGSGAEGETSAEGGAEEIPARRAERTGRERCGGSCGTGHLCEITIQSGTSGEGMILSTIFHQTIQLSKRIVFHGGPPTGSLLLAGTPTNQSLNSVELGRLCGSRCARAGVDFSSNHSTEQKDCFPRWSSNRVPLIGWNSNQPILKLS